MIPPTVTDTLPPRTLTKILIIEDHCIVSRLLAEVLQEQGGYSVVGEVGDRETALARFSETAPDIVILDIGLPGACGLDLIGDFRRLRPSVRIIVFTGNASELVVAAAVQLGVDGFIEKSAPFDQFLTAIERVREGQFGFGQSANGWLREIVMRGPSRASLSAVEMTVLNGMIRGLPAKTIAQELGRSAAMVYRIADRIRARFKLQSPWDLQLLAQLAPAPASAGGGRKAGT